MTEVLTYGRKFLLTDKKRYLLKNGVAQIPYLHLATVNSGLRDYLCFQCVDQKSDRYGEVWIEEMTGGHLTVIEDDNLFKALYAFLAEEGIVVVNVETPQG